MKGSTRCLDLPVENGFDLMNICRTRFITRTCNWMMVIAELQNDLGNEQLVRGSPLVSARLEARDQARNSAAGNKTCRRDK